MPSNAAALAKYPVFVTIDINMYAGISPAIRNGDGASTAPRASFRFAHVRRDLLVSLEKVFGSCGKASLGRIIVPFAPNYFVSGCPTIL